jgi:hypothetical protein
MYENRNGRTQHKQRDTRGRRWTHHGPSKTFARCAWWRGHLPAARPVMMDAMAARLRTLNRKDTRALVAGNDEALGASNVRGGVIIS